MVNALIDMYMKFGSAEKARRLFDECVDRNLVLYNTLMSNYVKLGKVKDALDIFCEMLDGGPKPDRVTMLSVLPEMVMWSQHKDCSMRCQKGILCLGAMAMEGRAGLLDEAIDFINTMPVEPNGAIWGAGCRIHKKEKMATCAAELITKSAKDKTGVHVLLSNIYTSAAKWDDVADERKRLKHAGYVPDLTNVLLDIDEQEKEFFLNRHSEKLAIAFGLVSSSQGMPIRVVKNLRMCSDCHSFAKMVSRVYHREIIIRDNNRLHFFWQGSCSCRDYW
ncbi:UNVERIFIED_CONTAM: Pentatricopeptide repeat-containing protein [Sesamum latifolium]|uniref:Pentatricopeptide repeat-containing protein n=1 Tax=Sesamum latifolium TaxID=2727402 RepID=A0AAW2UH52_9LAMI